MDATVQQKKQKQPNIINKSTGKPELWQEIYAPKTAGGQAQSVFGLTEVSTTIAPSTVKKGSMSKNESRKLLPILNSNYATTAQLSKNFIFPSIKKSASLMNLRAYSQQSNTLKRKIDYMKLAQLSQPKQNTTTKSQKLDLKKEKELAEEINQKKDEAANFINNIYKNEGVETINEYVTSIESLSTVKEKIEQFKIALQQKIKEYNESNFERTDKQHTLDELKKQLTLLEFRGQISEDAPGKIEKLQEHSVICQERLDMELLYTEQMNHMIERDKLLMLFMKQPIQEKKDDIEKILNSLLSIKALKTKMFREISKFEKLNKVTNEVATDKKQITDNMKEIFLSEISSKACFDEVYKNQMKIIEEKEKDHKQKKLEDLNLKQQEQQEKVIAEEKKKSEMNKKNAKYQEEFLKISEECNVKKISDLVSYQSDQIEQKKDLKQIADVVYQYTEAKQQKLKSLQDELSKLKYQVTQIQDAEQEKLESHHHFEETQLDVHEYQDRVEKKKEEMLQRKKKMKETIAGAIMSVARIAHQLKEDPKITPNNADLKLSVCGLRLEHMVATLYKKKPIFNIESVNTDYSSDLPPFFLGIKNSIFVNPPIIETERDNEIEKLYIMQQTKEKVKDEENDFLNDEYMKHKKVTKALQNQNGNTGEPLIISVPNNGKSDSNSTQNQLAITNSKFLKEKGKPGQDYQKTQDNEQSQAQNKGEKFDYIMALLNKGKKKPNTNSQQVVLLTDKDKEVLETKSQIQKQLSKIVHRTMYIFDPDKRIKSRETFKANRISPKKKTEE